MSTENIIFLSVIAALIIVFLIAEENSSVEACTCCADSSGGSNCKCAAIQRICGCSHGVKGGKQSRAGSRAPLQTERITEGRAQRLRTDDDCGYPVRGWY